MKPILKLYRGYANEQELIVMGHVLKSAEIPDYDFQNKSLKNAATIIKMYRNKTVANADVFLELGPTKIHTRTLNDGYFKFCIPLEQMTTYGWIDYKVSLRYLNEEITSIGSYVRPHKGNIGVISDIDDTFLISHTKNPLKKLFVLLFHNLNDRKVFEDVVAHYQALSTAGRNEKSENNAFFYVSSSEWNLYSFMIKFTKLHEFPKAVLLLKDIKTNLREVFFPGKRNHNHKFDKIKHILEFYPNLKYILLGDDSQQDSFLYETICKIFPLTVVAVYIRQSGSQKKENISKVLKNLEDLNVAVCYFKHSSEAIAHSKAIGIL